MAKANMVDKQCKETGWITPPRVLDPVRAYAQMATRKGIYLDPATTGDNPTGAEHYFTPKDDGITQDWKETAGENVIFLNPPYGGEIKAWVRKIHEESKKGAHIVALLAAQRFETEYYQECLMTLHLQSILFIRKRIGFLRGDGKRYPGNPYGSMILLFGGSPRMFRTAFRGMGRITETNFRVHS